MCVCVCVCVCMCVCVCVRACALQVRASIVDAHEHLFLGMLFSDPSWTVCYFALCLLGESCLCRLSARSQGITLNRTKSHRNL